jgi:hypothetical protein
VLDLESQRVVLDLRGDKTIVELEVVARTAGQPFAFLWPAHQAPIAVEVSDGERFARLDAAAAPRFESGRCDLAGQPGTVDDAAAGRPSAPVAAAAVDAAFVPADAAALTQWFRSAGFGVPAYVDDLASGRSDANHHVALRIAPAAGERKAFVRITLPREARDARWPRLAAFSAEGEIELTLYVVGNERFDAVGAVTTRELDRAAFAGAGLSRWSFAPAYEAASRKATSSGAALVVDSAQQTADGFVTRLHGWLFPSQLSSDIELASAPSASGSLSAAFRYCVEARRLAPAALPGAGAGAQEPVGDTAGCAVDGSGRRGGALACFPLALLVALVAPRRTRRAPSSLAVVAVVVVALVGCKGTQLTPDNAPALTACKASVNCTDSRVETVSCENGVPSTVTTNCPLGCAADGRSCGAMAASHVPSNLLETPGLADWKLSPPGATPSPAVEVGTGVRSTLFFVNADTGEIRATSETTGPVVRPAGAGVQAGISFTVVPQEGPKAPSLGVFVVKSLTVELGVILRSSIADLPAGGLPPNALVIVAQDGIDIAGFVDVSGGRPTVADIAARAAGEAAMQTPGVKDERADRKGFRNPGPGGYPGGVLGVSGFGPGGGGGAGSGYGGPVNGAVVFGVNPGGGGGGHGAPGGNGGAAFFGNAGGAGGLANGAPELVVLHGGSGGGAGGNDFNFANSFQPLAAGDARIRNGGDGGGGGGAVQLTALGSAGFRLRSTGGINASGAGGRHIANGFCCHVGAGGGGAGGAVLVEALRVDLEPGSFITVNGGGGAGADQTAGDTCCKGTDGLPGTAAPAPGGVGRGKGGDGGAGTAVSGQRGGTAQFTAAATAADTGRGSGGGGGGAAGRVRIHSASDQLTLTGAILSPDPTTTALSRGTPPLR